MIFPTMYLPHIHLGFRVASGFVLVSRLTHPLVPNTVPVRQVSGLPCDFLELGSEAGILNPTEKRAREPLKAEHSTHWAISSVVSSAA